MAENGGKLSPEELALIKGYYEKTMQLLKYNKAKDESIDRLSKEVERYRADFCSWVYKPLAMSLIDMRENCKRELAGMAGREYAAERLQKNFALLAEELECIITDNGGEITEDDLLYDGRSLLKPFSTLLVIDTRDIDKKLQDGEETEELTEEQPERLTEEIPLTLEELLDCYQKQITDILADNAVLEKTLKDALASNAQADADNKFRLIYPVFKELYLYAQAYRKEYCGAACAQDGAADGSSGDPSALKERYMQSLKEVIGKLLKVLNKLGVTILDEAGGKFDPACQQIAKTIATTAEEDDRKIVNYVTDGYLMGGKLIYRQKVDICKYKKQ